MGVIYCDSGKDHENYFGVYRVLYSGYIGIMEKKMEATIQGSGCRPCVRIAVCCHYLGSGGGLILVIKPYN